MLNNIQKKIKIDLTDERKLLVFETLSSGSDPRGSFFLLVAVSTLIAAFGLVMNSTAVVIGAMLVAPLMTPILGLSLALVRGDPRLMGFAVRSESAGIVVAILASALLGYIMPYYEATPEMLSRTQPNLFDLLVAVFAGLAGAYALVHEKLSPVLPGVAISTAIVPPLANVGLSLSLGAYKGAWGSFLLFFTNFLSILLVSAIVFFISGMAEEMRSRRGVTLARRFGVAVVGFSIIAVMLSGELVRILDQRRIRNQAWDALKTELTEYGISDMERLIHREHEGKILVLADVNGPRELSPRQVGRVQERLSDIVEKPVRLYLRTSITHDVSAKGAIHQGTVETLDGFFSQAEPSEHVKELQLAEQVVREYLDTVLGVNLVWLDSIAVSDRPIILATLQGVRNLSEQEIGQIEISLRQRLGKPHIFFIVHQNSPKLSTSFGMIRAELLDLANRTWDRKKLEYHIGLAAQEWLKERSFWVDSFTVAEVEGSHLVLFEINGPKAFEQQDLDELRHALVSEIGIPIKVYVRARIENVLGPETPMSFNDLLHSLYERSKSENLKMHYEALKR